MTLISGQNDYDFLNIPVSKYRTNKQIKVIMKLNFY